ncbi:unnamed protein product, partial [Dovyalis caffra]
VSGDAMHGIRKVMISENCITRPENACFVLKIYEDFYNAIKLPVEMILDGSVFLRLSPATGPIHFASLGSSLASPPFDPKGKKLGQPLSINERQNSYLSFGPRINSGPLSKKYNQMPLVTQGRLPTCKIASLFPAML